MYVDLTNMNSGFCDRLRQLTFCIAYEKLQKNKFKFIDIYEKKTPECPYYISELINIKNFKLKNVKKKMYKLLEWIHLIQIFLLKTAANIIQKKLIILNY